jgi:long-chain fatty acid transport protein
MAMTCPGSRRELAAALVAVLLGVTTVVGQAAAGGLLLYEVGTADLGLAGAGWSARAQDAATVLTNPAGMTHLEGTQILVGLQALYGNMPFEVDPGTSPALGSKGGNPVGWFPGGGVFATHQISPKLALGLAATGNFGLAEEYDDDWAGRYYVQKAALLGISVLPAVSYRLSESVSAGAALNAMYGMFDTRVAVNTITGPDGKLEVDDTTWGYGVNLGLIYDDGTGTRVGLTYTSQVVLDFAAPAEFSGLTAPLTTLLESRGLLDAEVGLGLRVPQTVMLSAVHQLYPTLTLLGSAGWQQWSRFGRVDVGVDSNDPISLTTESTFDDTWHGALGLQHKVSEAWRVDFGVGYDSAFQAAGNISPALPANDAWRFGLGLKSQPRPGFGWGVGFEYAYGGTLEVAKQSSAPVALGGRGDLVGAFEQTGMVFLSGNLEWRF